MSNPAESYETYMVPALFAPWASHLVRSANPQPGERVLDLACGTGVVARSVVLRIGSEGTVTAIDLSPSMLAVGRAAAESEGLDIRMAPGAGRAAAFCRWQF